MLHSIITYLTRNGNKEKEQRGTCDAGRGHKKNITSIKSIKDGKENECQLHDILCSVTSYKMC